MRNRLKFIIINALLFDLQNGNNRLPSSGRPIEDVMLQIRENFSSETYFNHELYSNILYIDADCTKELVSEDDLEYLRSTQDVSESSLTEVELHYIRDLLESLHRIRAQRVNLYESIERGFGVMANSRINTSAICTPATVGFPVGLTPYIINFVDELYVFLIYFAY